MKRYNIINCAVFVCILLLVTACTETGGTANQPEAAPADSEAGLITPISSSATLAPPVEATPVEATPELQPAASLIPPVELDVEALQNSTYRGILDEAVTLAGGTFEGEPFVSGGSSRPVVTLLPESVAFGDLNDDGQTDAAVVLVSDSGGSGTFIYLAAVQARDGISDNMATLLLGDRVQVRSLAVEDGRLVVRLLSHAPGDPACCPSLETTMNLRLSGDQLIGDDE